MRTDLIITSTDTSGKKITTTVTYIRSGITGAKLLELATALNDLTTNNYVGASREVQEVL